jgi:hypothetical protein
VAKACDWTRQHACPALTLTTFRDVPWNMPFYARLGFEEIPPDGLSPALRSVLEDEARRGFDLARRVTMKWLAQPKCSPGIGFFGQVARQG